MKYIILQGDGMADDRMDDLGGQTPLEAAHTPAMDFLARSGDIGLMNTVPNGQPVGSAVGNMSLLGIDPDRYYTGRAPLEARAQGIEIGPRDIAFRCNLVELDFSGPEPRMKDYSADHIASERAKEIIDRIDSENEDNRFKFYPGVSYRNLLIWNNGLDEIDLEKLDLTPPHDISGLKIGDYLPSGEASEDLRTLIKASQEVLDKADVSGAANSIWLWGQGTRPNFPQIPDKYGVEGYVVSAVDLIHGIGLYAGLNSLQVEGATGFLDTNASGKVQAASSRLESGNLVFLHFEAPDEASHMGDLELKVEAIEMFDREIVQPVIDYLDGGDPFSVLLATDHYTKISTKTHERGLVPFVIFRSKSIAEGSAGFNEPAAEASGRVLERGYRVFEKFLAGGST